TFLGGVTEGLEHWLILGDLSALYDLSALWVVKDLPKTKVRIVILNNGGGRIFTRMFRNKNFENEHEIEFSKWAEMFGVEHHRIESSWPLLKTDFTICEIIPDLNASEKFWQLYERSLN